MTRTILSASAIIETSAETVRRVALAARAGPVGENNAMLFGDHAPAVLEGGPTTFAYRSADGGAGTLEISDSSIRYTGGWWFRGTYSITGAEPGRTRVGFVVEDVARSPRWAVRLANRGFRGVRSNLETKFQADVARLAAAVGAPPPSFEPRSDRSAHPRRLPHCRDRQRRRESLFAILAMARHLHGGRVTWRGRHSETRLWWLRRRGVGRSAP